MDADPDEQIVREGNVVAQHWNNLVVSVGLLIEKVLKTQDYDGWVNGNVAARTALYEAYTDALVVGLEQAVPSYPDAYELLQLGWDNLSDNFDPDDDNDDE